jgi:hypothetical protein
MRVIHDGNRTPIYIDRLVGVRLVPYPHQWPDGVVRVGYKLFAEYRNGHRQSLGKIDSYPGVENYLDWIERNRRMK